MKRWLLIAIAALAFVGFTALGTWQMERRAWKLALIERVEQRVHAAPVAAPGPADWPGLTRENAEYRRVTLTGHWLEGRQTLVRAVTDLGEGFWLMEPLSTDAGFVVLVNRGWVPQGWHDNGGSAGAPVAEGTSSTGAEPEDPGMPLSAGATTLAPAVANGTSNAESIPPGDLAAPTAVPSPAADVISVTGLLRISEPHGAFLRSNDPTNHRWYSRDVAAISHAQHLPGAAPYFVDAEAATGPGAQASRPPVAGLTVIQFRNSHLQYVFTWFTLALMALWLGVRVARTR